MKLKLILMTIACATVKLASAQTTTWGDGNSRTETRDNAGLRGDAGAISGFYQTASPTNYPAGASSWWHLLDVRHSNPANNFAMQFSGSFFDQNLYFRKTADNAAQPWSRVLLELNSRVGVGTVSPQAKLHIAGAFDSPGTGIQDGNDRPGLTVTGNYPQLVLMAGGMNNPNHGSIISLGAFDSGTTGSFKSFTIGTPGVNANFMDIGYGTNTNPHVNGVGGQTGNIMRIKSDGSIGIGTLNPASRLDVEGGNPTEFIRIQSAATGSPGYFDIYSSAPGGFNAGTVGLNTGGAPIAMNVGGAEAMRVLNGKVGIGTPNPASALEVNGTVTANGYMDFKNGEPWFRVVTGPGIFHLGDDDDVSLSQNNLYSQASSGRIGIGTNSPISKLHISVPANSTSSTLTLGDRDAGNINVAPGEVTGGYNIDFRTWRDIVPDQTGARIRGERKNNYQPNSALIQSMDLAFYTSNGVDETNLTEKMRINASGQVGIGTSHPDAPLAVNGTVHAKEVKVDLNVPAPDYVFTPDYAVKSLAEVQKYIEANQHLPDVPSATEIKQDGIKVGEFNMLLLKKVEELTLYLIQKDNQLTEQGKRIEQLESALSHSVISENTNANGKCPVLPAKLN